MMFGCPVLVIPSGVWGSALVLTGRWLLATAFGPRAGISSLGRIAPPFDFAQGRLQAREACAGHAPITRNYCCGGWGVTVVVEEVSCFTLGGGAVVVLVTSVTGAGVVVVVVVSVTFG
jgi:hypothetical protein